MFYYVQGVCILNNKSVFFKFIRLYQKKLSSVITLIKNLYLKNKILLKIRKKLLKIQNTISYSQLNYVKDVLPLYNENGCFHEQEINV